MTGEIRRCDERFVDGNGNVYEFMLPDGAEMGFSSSTPFAPKMTTGDRKYGDYDPESYASYINFSGGMGQEEGTDTSKYADGNNIDTRSGKVVLGPLPNLSGPLPSGVVGGNHAAWWVINTTYQKRAKSFTPATGVTRIRRLWLPLKGTAAAGNVTVAIHSDDAGNPSLNPIEHGSATIVGSGCSRFGGWTQVVFSTPPTVSDQSTYWLVVTHNSGTVDLYWSAGFSLNSSGKVFTAGAWGNMNNAIPVFWYEDDLLRLDGPPFLLPGTGSDSVNRMWAYYGRRLAYISPSGTPTLVKNNGNTDPMEFAADALDAVWFNGSAAASAELYIACDTALYKFGGNVATPDWDYGGNTYPYDNIGDSGSYARRLAVHGNVLCRAYSNNKVDGSITGADVAADWGDPVTVGSSNCPIRRMLSWNGNLWVGKDDGLYMISFPAGYPASIEPPTCVQVIDFSAEADSWNFSCMVEYQGDLVFTIAGRVLKYTTGGVLTSISPDSALDVSFGERARFTRGVATTSTLWMLSEGPITQPSTLFAHSDGHWHPLVSLSSGSLARSAVVDPGWYGDCARVWFGSGLSIYYINMPMLTQRRWLWSGMDWASGGYIQFSIFDGNIRTVNKDWLSVLLDVRDVAEDGPYVTVSYSTGDDRDQDVYIPLEGGDADDDKHIHTSGLVRINFPSGSYSPRIRLSIGLYPGSINGVSTSPRVEAVTIKYMERPQDLKVWSTAYQFSDAMVWRNGILVNMTIADWIADLEALRESQEPVTWYPFWSPNQARTVQVVEYSASVAREQKIDGQDKSAVRVLVKLQEIQ